MFTMLRRFTLLSVAALLVLGTLTATSRANYHPDPGVPYFWYMPRYSYGYSYNVTPLAPAYGLGYNPYLYSGYNPYLYSGYSPQLYSGYSPYAGYGYNPYLYSGYSPYTYSYGAPYNYTYQYSYWSRPRLR
jgi:hypothetical protein